MKTNNKKTKYQHKNDVQIEKLFSNHSNWFTFLTTSKKKKEKLFRFRFLFKNYLGTLSFAASYTRQGTTQQQQQQQQKFSTTQNCQEQSISGCVLQNTGFYKHEWETLSKRMLYARYSKNCGKMCGVGGRCLTLTCVKFNERGFAFTLNIQLVAHSQSFRVLNLSTMEPYKFSKCMKNY